MNRAIQGSAGFGASTRRHGHAREPAPRLEPRAHPATRAGARTGPSVDDPTPEHAPADGVGPAADAAAVAAEGPRDAPGAAPGDGGAAAAREPDRAVEARPAAPLITELAGPPPAPSAAAAAAPLSLASARPAVQACGPVEAPPLHVPRRRMREARTAPAHTQLDDADAVAEAACRGTVTLSQRRATNTHVTTAAEGAAAVALAEMAAGRPSAFAPAAAGTALGFPTCSSAHTSAGVVAARVCAPQMAAAGLVDGVAVLRDSNHTRASVPLGLAGAAEVGGADAVAAAAVGVRLPRESGARRRPHAPAAVHGPMNGVSTHAHAPALLVGRDEENGLMAAAALGAENGGLFMSGWGRKKRRGHTPPVTDAPVAKVFREGGAGAVSLPPLPPDGPLGH